MFKVYNGNTRTIYAICSKLTTKTTTSITFWCLYSQLWADFTLFWCSTVDFEQVLPVWPNSWVLVYELSGSGFESSCRHLSNPQLRKPMQKKFAFCASLLTYKWSGRKVQKLLKIINKEIFGCSKIYWCPF